MAEPDAGRDNSVANRTNHTSNKNEEPAMDRVRWTAAAWLSLALAIPGDPAIAADPTAPAATAACSIEARAMWRDDSASADLGAARRQRFESAPRLLSQGYGAGAHWLRLQWRCDDVEAAPVLRVQPAFLDRIDVHQQDAAGTWRVERRGDTVAGPAAAWPATPRVALRADAAGPHTVYVRVETSGAALIQAQVMPAREADRLDSGETAALAAYLGALLVVTIWALLATHRRERELTAWFIAYQAAGAVTVVSLTGQLGALWPQLGASRHWIGSLAIFASAAAGARFCRLLLGPGQPAWLTTLPAVAMALLLACAVGFAAGAQRATLQAAQWLIGLVGVWCWCVALWPSPPGGGRSDSSREVGNDAAEERLKRLSFAVIGSFGILTAGRHLGGWTIGGAGTYSAPLNYGFTAMLMFALLLARDRRSRAIDRELHHSLAIERALAAQRSEQLQAKSELLTMLEHELKSPLTLLQFALADPHSPQTDLARDAVRDMAEVVARTAQIDRMQSDAWVAGEGRTLTLAPWIEALAHGLRSTADEQSALVIQIPPDLAIEADELLLRLVVGNLIDNALRYGDPQRPIRIEASPLDANGGLRLRVANAVGAYGRPDPDAAFERYHRAPEAQRLRGTGLGLWLARALARRLGGDLTMQPDPEPDMVVFELCLPSPPSP